MYIEKIRVVYLLFDFWFLMNGFGGFGGFGFFGAVVK